MERQPLPGEILLTEIGKLPKEEKAKLNYEGIVRVVSEEIAAVALHQEIETENQRRFQDFRREVAWESGEMVDN